MIIIDLCDEYMISTAPALSGGVGIVRASASLNMTFRSIEDCNKDDSFIENKKDQHPLPEGGGRVEARMVKGDDGRRL